MVAYYPLCAFGENRAAASIDTALHAFLPFDHVDHLHPDWAIALAASANGDRKLAEFNAQFGRRLIWVPWQRPGFELALMLRQAVETHPGCDGLVLGGHGLFTWGDTQRECYLSSVAHDRPDGRLHRGAPRPSRAACLRRRCVAVSRPIARRAWPTILPVLRGVVSSQRRVIAHWDDSEDALTFASSAWAGELAELGTSCPDHFLRTRICPMFVPWNPASAVRRPGGPHPRVRRAVSRRLHRLLPSVRRQRVARAARRESVGGRHAGARAVRLRQGQARGAHHDGVLRQRHPRHGGRHRARGRRRHGRRRAPGPAARAGGALSEFQELRGAPASGGVPDRGTGRSRKPNCSACRQSVNSAGRSRSWSARAAASAAKSCCSWRVAARTSLRPTWTWPRRKRPPRRPPGSHRQRWSWPSRSTWPRATRSAGRSRP